MSRITQKVFTRLRFATLFVLLLLPLNACSQERGANSRFVLRTEERFSEETAIYYHFDELRDGELFPAIMVAGNEIRLLSPGGHVHGRVVVPPSAAIVPTVSGRYVGVLRLQGSLETPNSVATQVFQVYDQNGVQMYRISEPVRFDETFGQFYLSDLDGRCVVANPGHGLAKFYDAAGRLQRTVDLFPDDSYDIERTLVVAMSHDGKRLALATMKRAPAPAVDDHPRVPGEPYLFLFDANGAELFRLSLPGDVVQSVALAPDGSTVAVSTYGTDVARRRTLLVDADGKTVRSIGSRTAEGPVARPGNGGAVDRRLPQISDLDMVFRHAAYSADGKRVLLAENRRLALVSTATAQVLWQWTLDPGEEIIVAVGLSPSASTAAALLARSKFEAGEFLMTGAHLTIFGADGSLLTTRMFPLEIFRKAYLKLSRTEVAVGFDTGYSIYRIE